MPSTISVHLGAAGIRIGLEFWSRLRADHGIGANGTVASSAIGDEGTFFATASSNRRVARAVFVDTEPAVIAMVASSSASGTFHVDNRVVGSGGAGDNFAKGYYTSDGVPEAVMARVHSEVSRTTEGLADFMLFGGIGGGTGGGLACAVAEKLRADFPDACITFVAVLSDPQTDSVAVRPYNEVLSLRVLRDTVDLVLVLDNAGLQAAAASLGAVPSDYSKHNQLAARALSAFTAPMRLPLERRADALELASALTPRKGLQFAGLAMEGWGSSVSGSVTANVLRTNHRVGGYRHADGKCLSPVFVLPRSRTLTASQVRDSSGGMGLARWFPPAPLVYPTRSTDAAALLVEAHSGISKPLGRIGGRFDQLFTRKAFVHWYVGEGMEESEFTQARASLTDLVADYGKVA